MVLSNSLAFEACQCHDMTWFNLGRSGVLQCPSGLQVAYVSGLDGSKCKKVILIKVAMMYLSGSGHH